MLICIYLTYITTHPCHPFKDYTHLLPKPFNKNSKMATEWSLDFCLVCDQQISGGGAYCSQSCRLADLDQQSSVDSVSSYSIFLSSKPSMQSKVSVSTPARKGGRPSLRTSASSSSSSSTSSQDHASSLPSTSSQTSLSSLTNTLPSPSVALSNQVRHELQDYTKCFDPVRDWKRRLTNS